ncbi:hypothetical protein MVEN_00016400 [Mycena venus]|uniref:Uncharacterized protein n=1 Tax=Mycena venus TaxID=2733690 RepID=A0A8H6Z606_9AGAR|nr:hypothetical protein MVEN_00016400 [Mycena venus]
MIHLPSKGRKSTESRDPGNAEDVDRPKLHYAQDPTNQTRSGAADAHSRPDLRKPIDSLLKFVAELDCCGTRTGDRRQLACLWSRILQRNFQGQRELKVSLEWRLQSELPRRHLLVEYDRNI